MITPCCKNGDDLPNARLITQAIMDEDLGPPIQSDRFRRNLFTQNHEIFETKRADIQNLLFTNIDVSQDNLEEDHKEEHVLDNEEDIEEVTEEDHVVDHEKDHMEDIEEEHKVFQSALDKLSDEGKRERFLIFFISGRFPLKQHCIRPVFGHC
ncbi:RIF1 [Mytilus edulis]|uniref:RIF1 n=1 Tax=Mytilus edulis TaxID=6550 RepID=A0A8S3RTH2_MYTED|nr:RIF1 [Mytilus edulis]